MSNVRYTPEAQRDLQEILAYLSHELDSPIAGRNMVKMIRKRILSLTRFPNSGEALDGYVSVKTDYRRLVCGNYLAFYRVEPETVNIIRVIHGSRNYARVLFGALSQAEDDTEE